MNENIASAVVSNVSKETLVVYPADGFRCIFAMSFSSCDGVKSGRAAGGSGGGEVAGEVGFEECFKADRKGFGESGPDI